ncbi:MAG TPA: hypothetical protein VIG99_16365 [Myxococcaceae bacterium]
MRSTRAEAGAKGEAKPATLPRVADPWWASELLRRRAELAGFLEARAGLSLGTAREVVDAMAAELAERFQANRRHYPAVWFREVAPEPKLTAAYLELLRTIALRRSYDYLRAEYRRRRLLPALEEHLRDEGRHPSLERTVDARKFLGALAAELEKLTVAERELLMKGDRLQPASGSERIRLHRLRRRLAAAVKKELLK